MEFKQTGPLKYKTPALQEAGKQEQAVAPPIPTVSSDIPVTGKRLFEDGATDLVKGIILAEVLGKPLSRRNRR